MHWYGCENNLLFYNLYQKTSKKQSKDIEEMAKGQKRPERAIPWKLKVTHKKEQKQQTKQHTKNT